MSALLFLTFWTGSTEFGQELIQPVFPHPSAWSKRLYPDTLPITRHTLIMPGESICLLGTPTAATRRISEQNIEEIVV